MLSDWFFASCVTKNPDKIAAFLSILETLDDPESTERFKIDSFHELAKSEVWFQVYAFYKILEMHRYGDRNSLNGQMLTAFDSYIKTMLDHAPEEVKFELENLLRDYFDSQSGDLSQSKLLDSFVSSAQGLVTKLSIRAFTPVPYLDINEFLPETVFLSILLNKVQTDSKFRVSFQISLSSDPAFVVIRQIIEKALDYQLGRLPLLIVIRLGIWIDTLGYTRDKILETIIRNRLNIDYEPDLLQAYAELCFADFRSPSKSTNTLSLINSILNETLSFNLLRELQHRLHYRPGSELSSLGYVGLTTPSTRLAFLLPLVYWQSTLWELAVQTDPNIAGAVLTKYWRIPEITKQTIELKSTINDRKSWQKEIEAFIEMRGLKDKLKINVINGQPNDFPEDAIWFISSPWLLSERKAKHLYSPDSIEGEKKRIIYSQYYESDRPEAIIRLLVASLITTRMLQGFSSENPNFSVLVSLISHATGVIEDDFNWLLKNFRDDRNFGEFPLPFVGFLLFARRQLNYLGRGYWNSVDPNNLVEIVRGNTQLRSDFQSKYGQKFLRKYFPEIMMRWIESAYTGVIDKTGPGRWLPLIPEVCSYYKMGHSDLTTRSNKIGLLNCSLIEKYLSQNGGTYHDEEFDWQKIGSEEQSWDIDYHFLLISQQGLPPSAWWRREWQEPVWETGNYKPLTRLVRSLERVVSLGYSYNIPTEICDQWKKDWIESLDAIHEQRDLDRFVRIRLIQLVDNPVFAERPDGLMLISNIILEYGCTYDLKLLLDKIFPLNDFSFYNKQSSPAFRNMQISVIQSLCAFVDNYIENDDEKNYYVDIQDPKQKRKEYQKNILFKEYLAKIAYISWLNQKQGMNINFSDYIEKYRYKQNERASKWKYRISKADFEDTGGSRKLVMQESDQKVSEWNLRCAVVNPNELTINLFYQDFDTAGINNLFTISRQELLDIKNSEKRIKVLSILVDKEIHKNGNEKYTFNVGFDFYLSIIHKPLRIERGDYLELELFKDIEKERWIIERDQSFTLIKQSSREGDIALAKINESIALGHKKLIVEVNNEYINEVNLSLWDADISRAYTNLTLLKDKYAFVRFSKENSWIPIELDLADLLRIGFGQPCLDSCVLTFIRENTTTGTEFSWVFSREPGENYLLFNWQFTEESVSMLQEEIDKYSDPAGLLVVIEPIEVDGRVLLRLASEKSYDAIAQYEKLDSPFDSRNIRWREVFQISRIAEKINNTWRIDITDTEIPGFPTSILVNWNRYLQERNENKIEINVIGWNDKDQRINTVRAEQIYSYRILPKGKEWSKFYDKWINLKTGDKLIITKTWKYVEPGMILACTEENILVMLEPETITLGALSNQNCPHIATPREGEITRIVWSQRSPINIEIPDLEGRLDEEQELTGIFVEIPGSKDGGTLCKLKWKIDGQIINTDVQVEGITKLNITIGSKLFAHKSDNIVQYSYSKPSIIVSLLWSICDWSDEEGDFSLVGSSEIGNEKYTLAEEKSDPGRIYKFPVLFSKYSFLSTGNGREFSGGISPETKISLAQKGNPWKDDNNSLIQRVSLSYNGKILFGIVKGRFFEKDVHLANISIKISPSKNYPGCYIIRREFTLYAAKKIDITKKNNEQDSKLLCARLNEYFIKPYNVDAYYKDGNVYLVDLQTPIDQTGTKWTPKLSIASGEGTFLIDPDYSQAAIVRIINDNNSYLASLRMVPPILPDEFRVAVGADYNDDSFRLEVPLFYVGKEDSNPLTGEEGIFHRFEWGYGKTVIIPNEFLRYNGGPFSLSQMVLFYGDSVTKIIFKEIQSYTHENVTDQRKMCYFEIYDQNIQFSRAHTLFYQKSKFQMLHTLRLHVSEKDINIVDIEGFDESQLSSQVLSFEHVQASLSDLSKTELLQRYNEIETPGIVNNDIYILGRFNEEEYKGSLGKIVNFDHVNLSFDRSSEGHYLHNNELLFMEAGEIKTGLNDMGLLVFPVSKIHQLEIGADFQNPIFLLRRNFSVREDLLPQIYSREGKGALKKTILLVRLSKNNEKIYSSIRKNIPSRKTQALATAIRQKTITFANIEEITSHQIRLEINPGVYVDLKNTQIDGNPSELEMGDIVRLENSSHNVFHIIRSIFSDRRYVPQSRIRRAVALPKNLLLKKQTWETDDVTKEKFWKDQNLFTIGGLPNIQAMMGDSEKELLNRVHLVASRAIELMQKPHPKIVEISSASPDKFVVRLPEQDVFCGRLEFSPDLKIDYSPVSGPNHHLLSSLDWKKISFGDQSKLDIIDRCKKLSWSYHDKKTGNWSKDSKEVEIVDITLQTTETGPLFFEEFNGDLVLRYSKQKLFEFGYPARELIQLLRLVKKGWFPIAGISQEQSFWIEIIPGRIIEISMSLVSWRIGQKLVSLENFDCSKLSIGDELELELDETDILSADILILKSWKPGPRGSFGQQDCYLPVQAIDHSYSFTRLGIGEYSLILPDIINSSVISLNDNNDVSDASSSIPKSGDVILLGLNEVGELIVNGFPQYSPRPEQDDEKVWIDDPLSKFILKKNQYGKYEFKKENLVSLVKIMNGSIPMTVEHISSKGNIFLSRKYQWRTSIIDNKKLMPTNILGLMSDGHTVILKAGSGILAINIQELVIGIPSNNIQRVIDSLIAIKSTFWLRGTENGNYVLGIADELTHDPYVHTVCEVSEGESDPVNLVVQSNDSMKYYWLATSKLAWTQLLEDEIHRVYHSEKNFKMRIISKDWGHPSSSVIDLHEIQQDLVQIKVGKQITIEIISQREKNEEDDQIFYLAKSVKSGVLLECCSDQSHPLKEGEFLTVEVTSKVITDSVSVTCVPSGNRQHKLDLLNWQLQDWPAPGEFREQLQNYLSLSLVNSSLLEKKPEQLEDTELDLLLSDSYNYIIKNPIVKDYPILIAQEWYKRNHLAREIFLPYSIMTILILDAYSSLNFDKLAPILGPEAANYLGFTFDWKSKASSLLHDIGRRAIRSMHVEVLSDDWILNKENRPRHDGLWDRLSAVEGMLKTPIQIECIHTIQRLNNAVNIRSDNDIISISDSLLATIGSLERFDFILQRAFVTKELIKLCATMPTTKSGIYPHLLAFHREGLKSILDSITIQALDITLLDPLPKIESLPHFN